MDVADEVLLTIINAGGKVIPAGTCLQQSRWYAEGANNDQPRPTPPAPAPVPTNTQNGAPIQSPTDPIRPITPTNGNEVVQTAGPRPTNGGNSNKTSIFVSLCALYSKMILNM